MDALAGADLSIIIININWSCECKSAQKKMSFGQTHSIRSIDRSHGKRIWDPNHQTCIISLININNDIEAATTTTATRKSLMWTSCAVMIFYCCCYCFLTFFGFICFFCNILLLPLLLSLWLLLLLFTTIKNTHQARKNEIKQKQAAPANHIHMAYFTFSLLRPSHGPLSFSR